MTGGPGSTTANVSKRATVLVPLLAPVTIDEHSLNFSQLVGRYGESVSEKTPKDSPGLELDAIEKSRVEHGANVLPSPKKKSLITTYLEQMTNLFTFVLLLCGALSLVVFIIDTSFWVNLYTAFIFWGVAIFNAGLEFWQSYSSAKTLEGFQNLVPATCLVRRAGQLFEVDATDLVVGDIVLVKTGNKTPADCRVLWCDNLRVDNSSLTGESEPQERSAEVTTAGVMEANNLLFSGTNVVSGESTALVIRTGPNTVIGRLASFAVKEPPRVSMLEREMTVFFRRLVFTASIFAAIGLTLGFSLGLGVKYTIDVMAAVLVSFLPQGLPATMTILLTSAAKRMAARNVLVKNLRSVETLGAMTLLATDKTGTLTQNKMCVVGAWVYGRQYRSVEELMQSGKDLNDFFFISALCTSCMVEGSERDQPSETRQIFGDATEVGILRFIGKFLDLDETFQRHSKVLEFPFTSVTKWHLTIYELNGQYRIIMKGAPERILNHCTDYRMGSQSFKVDEELRKEFMSQYETFAALGLRIIAVASRILSKEEYAIGFEFRKNPVNFPIDSLEFQGFICLRDPPKEGVSWAVQRLQDANVQVVMVTGDHPLTAEAIARQVGILTALDAFKRPPMSSDLASRPNVNAAIIHGETLDSLTSGDWQRLVMLKEIVFARTAPRHKLEIVRQFQLAGHIVAVSGDGVNDSPALRKAHLGVSMNKTASDVSKDAAQLILLDDNFVSIVAGVYEGRLIFENVKKSIRYTLTHITSEVSALLLYCLLIIPPPLSPILLIFIDVAAELGPAVSYAQEPAEFDLMILPSRQRVEPKVDIEIIIRSRLIARKIPNSLANAIARVIGLFSFPSTGENAVDFDLIFWAFFEGGVIVALGAWGAYVITLVVYGFPLDILYRSFLTYFSSDSPPLTLSDGTIAFASDQTKMLARLQASYFQAILIAQWFNLFAQKHRYRLPWGRDLFVNKLTYVGIFSAMMVLVIVAYLPAIHEVFKTFFPPALALAPAFGAGIFLIIYEFLRRYLRHHGWFGGIPDPRVLKKPKKGVEERPAAGVREPRLSLAQIPGPY